MEENTNSTEKTENGENRRRKHSEGDETVTIDEILEAQEYAMDTEIAVLGACDDENCSYDQGYVNRQALYSCLTCNPINCIPYVPAGLCLACSLKCHAGHELVELYTKRNFRCDCGTKRNSNAHCLLQPVKNDFNTENIYNQNFKGLYCLCSRPYPDPDENEDGDDDDDDQMIQCVVCEDWFHGRHTNNDSVDLDNTLIDTSDFVCSPCTQKCHFLKYYKNQLLTTADSDNSSQTLGLNEEVDTTDGITKDGNKSELNENECNDKIQQEDRGSEEESSCNTDCPLHDAKESQNDLKNGTWWKQGWRAKLCTCEKCVALYKELRVNFLVDPEDPLEVYEAKGRQKRLETGDRPASDDILRHLSNIGIDRIAQVELLHSFNEMKDGFAELVNRITESGRAVTSADVKDFFEQLTNKRRRL